MIAPPGPLGLSEIASLLRTAGVTVAWLTAGLFHQLAETDIDAIAGVPVRPGGRRRAQSGHGARRARGASRAASGQRVRPDREHHLHHVPCHDRPRPGRRRRCRSAARSSTPPCTSSTRRAARADRRDRRAVHRRGRAGPRLRRERRRDGAGVRARPVRARHAPVPDRRPGPLARRTGPSNSSAASTIRSRSAGSGSSPARSRRFSARIRPCGESVVVVAGEGAQRHLIGYVTPADGVDPAALRPSALRDFVAQRLPDYLVPAGFKAVDRFPLNANGKVDRAALPAPDRDTRGPATPPRGATEERLADIWRRLLPENGTSGGDIGREDSFFALGGNSLLAARLMFRIARGVRRRAAPGRVLRGRPRSPPAPPPSTRLGQPVRPRTGRRDRTRRRQASAAGTAAPTAWPPRSPHRTSRAWWRPTRERLTRNRKADRGHVRVPHVIRPAADVAAGPDGLR